MITKNATGMQVATVVTARTPPQKEMAAIVRAVYRITPGLDQPLELERDLLTAGSFCGDQWDEDDDDRVGEIHHASDLVPFKPSAEVLLHGSCHAPDGQPTTECPVRVAVGSWEKSLIVSGQRLWQAAAVGHTMTAPVPFTAMPLTWSNAWGGPGVVENPGGRGHRTEMLPCVEYPAHRVASPTGNSRPASFAPLSPLWPMRKKLIGTNYGSKWKKERAPFFADDFDWHYFNAAPDDQRLPDYLVGNEAVTLQNLHADAPLLRFALPSVQPRVFVRDDDGAVREIALALDTLVLRPDDNQLVLTWRGLTPCRELDLADITHLVIDVDPLGEPRADQHYHDLLAGLDDDPLSLRDHIPAETADQLEEVKRLASLETPPTPRAGNPVSAAIQQRFGNLAPEVQAQLEQQINQAVADFGGASLADWPSLDALLADGITNVPAPAPASPHMVVGQVLSQVAKAREAMAAGFTPEQLAPVDEPLEQFLQSDAMKDYLPASMKSPEDRAAEAAIYARDLSGHDFSHQDLTGENFTGCKLVGANFTGATIAGISFAGADLRYSVLHRCVATGTDFTDADLSFALLDESNLEFADFSEAKLDNTGFNRARMKSAVLNDAVGTFTRFTEADLTDVQANRFVAGQSLFEGATLDNADFSHADLSGSSFARVHAHGINLEDATIRKLAAVVGADLTEARVAGADGDESVWIGAKLINADFSDASLERAHFTGATCINAAFAYVNLAGAQFRKAGLEKAKFLVARMMNAQMMEARCVDTAFVDCTVFGAVFTDATLANCDFSGTDTSTATLTT